MDTATLALDISVGSAAFTFAGTVFTGWNAWAQHQIFLFSQNEVRVRAERDQIRSDAHFLCNTLAPKICHDKEHLYQFVEGKLSYKISQLAEVSSDPRSFLNNTALFDFSSFKCTLKALKHKHGETAKTFPNMYTNTEINRYIPVFEHFEELFKEDKKRKVDLAESCNKMTGTPRQLGLVKFLNFRAGTDPYGYIEPANSGTDAHDIRIPSEEMNRLGFPSGLRPFAKTDTVSFVVRGANAYEVTVVANARSGGT